MELQDAFDAGFDAVRAYVDGSFAAFEKRMAALEARALVKGDPGEPGRDGKDGKDADLALIESLIAAKVADLPKPRDGVDGKSLTADDIRPLIESAVERAVSAIPKAKDGSDGIGVAGAMIDREGHLVLTLSNGTVRELGTVVGKSVLEADVQPIVARAVDAAVALIPKPEKGESYTLADIKALVDGAVAKEVAALPKPIDGINGMDGKSVTLDDVKPLVAEAVQKAVSTLPSPKPGLDGKSVTLDDVAPMIRERISSELPALVKAAISEIPPAKDGKDADPVMIEEMVKKAVATIPVPRDGKDADPDVIEDMVTKAVANIPRPLDGKSVDMQEVDNLVTAAVDRAVKALPPANGVDPDMIVRAVQEEVAKIPPASPGKDGVDADPNAIAQVVLSQVTDELKKIPVPKDGQDGKDGKSVTPDEVEFIARRVLEPLVSKAVGEIRVPEDGKSITVADVKPLLEELVSKEASKIPVPKDGVGVASGMIDRDGKLILTLSDGKSVDLGRVEGKDGDSVDVMTVKAMIDEAVKSLPAPKDGSDGLGFDDLDVVETDGGFMLQFVRGDRVKEVRLPIPRDCGTFKIGTVYNRGDGVTDGGSFWIAQKDGVTERPSSCDGWRLAVKKGKDRSDPVKLSGRDS